MEGLHKDAEERKLNVCVHANVVTEHFKVFNSQLYRT